MQEIRELLPCSHPRMGRHRPLSLKKEPLSFKKELKRQSRLQASRASSEKGRQVLHVREIPPCSCTRMAEMRALRLRKELYYPGSGACRAVRKARVA